MGVGMGSDEEDGMSVSEEVTTGVDVVTSVDSTISDVAEEIANSTIHAHTQVQMGVHFITYTYIYHHLVNIS